MFINSFLSSNGVSLDENKRNLSDLKSIDGTALKNYFKYINKYKLYSNLTPGSVSNSTRDNISNVSSNIYLNGANTKPNYSIYKLKCSSVISINLAALVHSTLEPPNVHFPLR